MTNTPTTRTLLIGPGQTIKINEPNAVVQLWSIKNGVMLGELTGPAEGPLFVTGILGVRAELVLGTK